MSCLMTKPIKWHVHPSKTQISLDICPVWSESSLSAMKKAWVFSYPQSAHRRLIRLGGCPGWSESSLGTPSFCWFYHETAHIYFQRTILSHCVNQISWGNFEPHSYVFGERGGSVVECRTPEREVGGSKPTAAVLCPWARHFSPRKYWLITQEAMAPSQLDWKIVDWDVKPQHKQTNKVLFSICKFLQITWNLNHTTFLALL